MAIIYSYPEIPDVQGGDLLLISDTGAPNKPTRSVDIDDLAAYIGTVVGVVQNLQSVLTVGNTYVSPDGYGTFTLNDIANNDGSIKFANTDEGWGYQISAEEGFNITDGHETNLMSIYSSGLSIRNGAQIMNIGTNALTATRNVYFPDASGTIALENVSEWYNVTGSRGLGNLLVKIGDYDNSGNGTFLSIDDADQSIIFTKGGVVESKFVFAATQDRDYTFPNADGTIALTSDIPAPGPSGSGTANYTARWTNASTLGIGALYDNGTNVGIGTTSASQKLEVSGNSLVTGTQFIGDTFTKIQQASGNLLLTNQSSSGAIRFLTNNTERVRITSAGNVGIGTTSPSSKLHIEDSISNGSVFKITTSTSGTLQPVFDARISSNGDGFFDFNTYKSATKKIQIKSANTSYIQQVDGSGGFDIKGHLKTSLQTVNGGGVLQLHRYGALSLNNDASYAHTPASALYINTFYNTSTDYLMLLANQGSDKLAVDLNGNVGIGTNSPSEKLHVVGNARVTGAYYDSNNSPGTANQVLVSTATGTDWVDGSGSGIIGGPYLPLTGGTLSGNLTITKSSAMMKVSEAGGGDIRMVAGGSTGYVGTYNNTSMQILQNGSNAIFIDTSKNIGIGTTNPTHKLEVVGDSNDTMRVYRPGNRTLLNIDADAGRTSALAIDIAGTTQYYVGMPTQAVSGLGARFAISYKGAPSFILEGSSGNIGIGTTSPSEKLEVDGNIKLTGNLNVGGYISPNDESGNLSIFGGNDTTNDAQILLHGSSNYWGSLELNYGYDAVNSFFKISQGANEHLRITNGGKVGIGTTSPSEKLHVDAGKMLITHTSTEQYNYKYGNSDTWSFGGGDYYTIKKAGIRLFTLNGAGNVGIGTTNPSQKLHINNSTASSASYAKFSNAQTGITTADGFDVGVNTGAEAVIWQRENSNLLLATNNSERMRITSDGKVGIGTTNPLAKLQVSSTSGWGVFTERGIKDGLTSTYSHSFGAGNAHILGRSTIFESSVTFSTLTANAQTKEYRLLNSSNKLVLASVVAGITTEDNILVASGANIGIGTNSPSEKLHVFDTAVVVKIEGNGVTSANLKFKTNETDRWNLNVPSGSTDLRFTTGSSDTLTLKSSGNVGIGTTSPSAKLHVVRTIDADGSLEDNLQLKVENTIEDRPSGIEFRSNRNGTVSDSAAIVYTTTTATTNTRQIHLIPEIGVSGDLSNSSLIAKAGGRVKVGNSTYAAQALEISGTSVRLDSGSGGDFTFEHPRNGNVFFQVNNQTTLTLDKNNGGRVGIGTTAPTTKLQVNGDVRIYDENELYFGGTGSVPNWEITASGSDLIVNDTGTNVGSVLFNNDEGVALPRLTTTEINAISSPIEGLMAYNTTLNTICFYNGSSWQKVSHANM